MLPLFTSTTCCLVTGSTDPSSIGYACVLALLNAGVGKVTIMGRDPIKVTQAIDSIRKEHHHAPTTTNGTTTGASTGTGNSGIETITGQEKGIGQQEEEKNVQGEEMKQDENEIIFGVVGDLKEPMTMEKVIADAIHCMGGRLDVVIISGGNGTSEYLGLNPKDPHSYHIMYNVAVVSPMMLIEAAVPELSKMNKDDSNKDSTAAVGGRDAIASDGTPLDRDRDTGTTCSCTESGSRSKSGSGGSVVMIGSMASYIPWPDTAPYNYARAAQNTLTQTVAFKYRTSNIRINTVLPGCIHTGALDVMAQKKNIPVSDYAALRASSTPMERNGTPMDVANTVVYLASPFLSAYTTGELIKVDGGLHLSNWFNRPIITNQYIGNGTNGTSTTIS